MPFRCFTCVDLPEAGFVGRLLGRKPKDNCYIEVQNLLATRAVNELTAADVENLLSEYILPRDDANPRLTDFYAAALRDLAHDGELSEADRTELKQLRYVLGLGDDQADAAQQAVLREVYQTHLVRALQDGHLSDGEKAALDRITRSFALPDSVTTAAYKEEVLRVLQQAFNTAIADRRYTATEEEQLVEMGRNLGITVTHTAEDLQKLERFRLLAQIDAGELPAITSAIRLQRGEVCHFAFACRLHEKRTVTKRVNFAGPSGRIRIMKGLSYRYGSVSVSRVTSEEMRQIDTGSLYVTNKRLVFNGAAKNLNVPYKKVIGFTMYSDGVQIEKDTGRDQYFIGPVDKEVLGAILDAAVSRSQTGAV